MYYEKSWWLFMVKDQKWAYGILLGLGLIISSLMWNLFINIGGVSIHNSLYWILSLFIWIAPQLGLYGEWNLKVKPQIRAQIVFRSRRQNLWLTEGIYIIPFYKLLFTVNASEIQHTSRMDVKVPSFKSHDVKGEELNLQVRAEKIIINPSLYAEFEEAEMKEDEKEILSANIIRTVRKKNFWTEILGKEEFLLADFEKDPIYLNQCKKYGLTFASVVLTVTNADTSIESRTTKRNRIVATLIEEFKQETGKDKLTDSNLKDIRDQAELLMKLAVDKTIVQGVSQENIHYRAGDGPKNTNKP